MTFNGIVFKKINNQYVYSIIFAKRVYIVINNVCYIIFLWAISY